MTDESIDRESGKPAKTIYGSGATYELDGETVVIRGFALDDGGYAFEFDRAGRIYPLRLSRTGMEATLAVFQDILWKAPRSTDQTSASGSEGKP